MKTFKCFGIFNLEKKIVFCAKLFYLKHAKCFRHNAIFSAYIVGVNM